jgi:hypothetical protein
LPARYTDRDDWPDAVTGFTSSAEPTIHWSCMSNVSSSSGNSTHIGRITGMPVEYDSKNTEYLVYRIKGRRVKQGGG